MELTKNKKLVKPIFLTISIITFCIILISCFAIVNINVSLKYEVDQAKTAYEIKGIDNDNYLKELEREFTEEKETAKTICIIALIFFVIFTPLSVMYKRW